MAFEVCVKCKRTLPSDAFSPSVLKHRLVLRCRECVSANKKRHRPVYEAKSCERCGALMPGHSHRRFCSSLCRTRALLLRHRYGLPANEDLRLYNLQKGLCALCHKSLSDDWDTGKAHIDHDHITGQIRGLLHGRCNVTLAETAEHHFNAAAYLEGQSFDLRDVLRGLVSI